MIKVLHFIPGFSFGGIETIFKNNFQNIDKDKIQLHLMVEEELSNLEVINSLKEEGYQIYSIPRLTVSNVKDYIMSIKEILINHDFQIIHSYNIIRTPILFMIAKSVGVDKRIFHARTNRTDGNLIKKSVYRLCIALGTKNSTELLACSKEAGDFFFDNYNYNILKNGIDTKKFLFDGERRHKIRSELKITNNATIIGHVGRFTEAKNHLFLLDIFSEYLNMDSSAYLLLVGDGPLKDEILDKIESLNLNEHVIMVGAVENVQDYYQAMDMFLFPSIYEGFGNVVIEAQASGLRVLASNNVPKSTKISNLVKFCSLNDESPEQWATQLKGFLNYTRENMENFIIESGYDIKSNAETQELIYLNMMNTKEYEV